MRIRALFSGALKAGLLLVAAGLVVWALHPWPVLLRWQDPATTAYIQHRERAAQAAGEAFELRWSWISLEEIPSNLTRAVLIGEDHRFRDHGGVDWDALAEEVRYRGPIPPNPLSAEDRQALREAVDYVRENRDRIRGRSTLTQQLARNLYLSPERSFMRKAQELLIARRLEFLLSKDRILELYLNVAELGPGIFGVEAASQAYFGVSARQLSTGQAAALAATLPHPLTSNPAHAPGRMAWRRDLILERMQGPPPERPLPPPVEVAPPVLPDPEPPPDPGSSRLPSPLPGPEPLGRPAVQGELEGLDPPRLEAKEPAVHLEDPVRIPNGGLHRLQAEGVLHLTDDAAAGQVIGSLAG
jgi:monofunctional glycosyltransferase